MSSNKEIIMSTISEKYIVMFLAFNEYQRTDPRIAPYFFDNYEAALEYATRHASTSHDNSLISIQSVIQYDKKITSEEEPLFIDFNGF